MPDAASRQTHRQRLAAAAKRLAAVTETPDLDAQILLAHALGMRRAQLLARLRESGDAATFETLLARRLAFEPLAHILGEWEFFSLSFATPRPLLVPRPETEHLVEAVLEFAGDRTVRILEIGTGTGCVAVAIARSAPNARIVATDIHPLALATAARNARRHGVAERVLLCRADLFEAFVSDRGSFDVVCANPPYIDESEWEGLSPTIRRHEDPRALLAGHDGLEVIRRIIARAAAVLAPGGFLAFEIGESHAEAARVLLADAGYADRRFVRDLAGIERIACGRALGGASGLDSR